MEISEKIDFVKILMNDENLSDNIVSAFLKLSADAILNRLYPYDKTKTEVPERYCVLQCEIATYLLNKRGAEGETSHSELGIDRTYENGGIPASYLNQITPYVGV